MPLTTTPIPVSAPVNGYQDGKLAGICQAWGSMAKLAADFGARIKQLREDVLDESQEEFAVRWGRARKQIGTWESGGQTPHRSTVVRVAREQGWPMAIFDKGGPMPVEALKRPVNERMVREPSAPAYGTAKVSAGQQAFLEAMEVFTGYTGRGELIPPGLAIEHLGRVYNQLVSQSSDNPPADADADAVRRLQELREVAKAEARRHRRGG